MDENRYEIDDELKEILELTKDDDCNFFAKYIMTLRDEPDINIEKDLSAIKHDIHNYDELFDNLVTNICSENTCRIISNKLYKNKENFRKLIEYSIKRNEIEKRSQDNNGEFNWWLLILLLFTSVGWGSNNPPQIQGTSNEAEIVQKSDTTSDI